MQPLLSIVIANYNYGRFLEEAIQSVLMQDAGDLAELIICDAESTDNSVEVIKKYEKHITWWCSEKDGGQSAAFNKGFSHARGKFLTWLNADDVMMPGTLKAFEDATARHPDCEWFVGGVMWLDKEMKIIKCGRGRHFSRLRANAGRVRSFLAIYMSVQDEWTSDSFIPWTPICGDGSIIGAVLLICLLLIMHGGCGFMKMRK